MRFPWRLLPLCSGLLGGRGLAAEPAADIALALQQDRIAQLAARLHEQWAARSAEGAQPVTVTEPWLASGRILTASIDVRKAPGVPAVQVVLSAGTVGAAYFSVGVVSPNGLRYYVTSGDGALPAYPREPPSETVNVRLRYPFGASMAGLYTARGIWSLYVIQLVSMDGTIVTYNARQLAALFPSLAINVFNSGTPDITPPVIGTGRILTPIVSVGGKSPYFAARLSVSDDLSGVIKLGIVAAGPQAGAATVATQATIDFPMRQGAITTFAKLPPGTPAGTYGISYIYACDVATNCTYKQKTADIQAALGSATFLVTD